jgi:hypothetical protein
MSTKSPFEIRLDLLHLAQSILSDRSWQKRNVLEQNWNAQRENALIKTPVPPFPEMDSVTTEDIIAEAKKLNEFVSNG